MTESEAERKAYLIKLLEEASDEVMNMPQDARDAVERRINQEVPIHTRFARELVKRQQKTDELYRHQRYRG